MRLWQKAALVFLFGGFVVSAIGVSYELGYNNGRQRELASHQEAVVVPEAAVGIPPMLGYELGHGRASYQEAPAVPHDRIHINFLVEGRKFEAVGFLREGEESVSGAEMLGRVAGENGGAIGDEDGAFLSERLEQLRESLRPYYLVTGRRGPSGPPGVSCFHWNGGRWYQDWCWLDYLCSDDCLVVRRLP